MDNVIMPHDAIVVTASVQLAMDQMAVALRSRIEGRAEAIESLIADEVGKIDVEKIIQDQIRLQARQFVERALRDSIERVFREEMSGLLQLAEDGARLVVKKHLASVLGEPLGKPTP